MKQFLLLLAISSSLSVFSQIPAYVPVAGLQGYWPFDNSGSDLGPNGNHGTVFGATPTADRFGTASHAYNFDGSSNYVLVPDAPSLSGYSDLSISAWIKPNLLSGNRSIAAKWWQYLNCGSESDTYEVALSNGSIQFATNFNNYGLTAPPAYTPALNTWKHLVFIYDHINAKQYIYLDGNLIFNTAAAGPDICSSTNDLYLGADFDGYHTPQVIYRYFSGALDDIGIWNRVLSPCEIKQLYTGSVLALSASTSNTQLCQGVSATLTATGADQYTWSNGQSGSSIVVSPGGTTTYTVTGTSTLTGCSSSTTFVQNVRVCTGISEAAPGEALSVYPNPTNGRFFVNGPGNTFYLEISNALGELVYKGENTKEGIDLGSRQAGIYFIKIDTGRGSLIKKITKE